MIVSAYNSARYVGPAVESVLRQTWSDLEAIVVDDGSTDETAALASASGDPRLRVIRQSNRGSAGAGNTGIGQARGRYVAFLDADDMWRPTKLMRHLECMEGRPDLDLTFSWSRVIGEKGKELSLHSLHWRGEVTAQQLLVDFVVANSSSVVIRKSALDLAGGLDPAFPNLYDMDLCLRVALLRQGNACAVPDELTLYRRRPGQLSRQYSDMQREWERLLCKFEALIPGIPEASKRMARANSRRYLAYLAYEAGDYRRGLGLLGEGMGHTPLGFLSDTRNWKMLAAIAAGLTLPTGIHRGLQRWAGVDVSA